MAFRSQTDIHNLNDSLAVDIALLPSGRAFEVAAKLNRELRQSSREGFSFDSTHLPHITLLQQLTDGAKAEELWGRVGHIAKGFQPLRLRVAGLRSQPIDDGRLTLHGLVVESDAELKRLRESLVEAGAVARTDDGTAEAFVLDPGETLLRTTIDWTKNFATKIIGEHFRPHLTVGIGVSAATVDPFEFTVDTIAACQMGNYYTCRKILRQWKLGTIEA